LVRAHRGRVVAIGETGLDCHYNFSPLPVQATALASHLELARQLDMPIVLHIRDAHEQAWAIVDAQPARQNPGIVHCFSGTPSEAREWVRRGWHLSFSGIATFSTAAPVLEAARQCPADRMLIETDAPYLAPQPMRGRKNEPAYVSFTCAIIAAARGASPETFASCTAANARRVLGLPMPAAAAS
jgi:TatD DNase family protein